MSQPSPQGGANLHELLVLLVPCAPSFFGAPYRSAQPLDLCPMLRPQLLERWPSSNGREWHS
jgi:hypothetical protein